MKQFNAHRGIVLTTGVMQIFVRVVGGQTHALNVHRLDTGLHIKLHLQALSGIPASAQRLSYGGRGLGDGTTLAECGVTAGGTLQQLLSLPGGAPVKVLLLDPLPSGLKEVVVQAEADTPLLEVKRQLALATGVPVREQRLLLSAINQLVMGTKRGGLGYTHCGTASSLHFAVKAAQRQ